MKSNLSLLMVICCFSIMACQKQHDVMATDQNEATFRATVSTNASVSTGTSAIDGAGGQAISQAAAESMAREYAKQFGTKQTRSVSFSIKALKKYLTYLESKNKSDIVFVNFGVYNEKTAPASKYVNRLTVFFWNNDPFATSSSLTRLASVAPSSEEEAFNMGGIRP